MADVTPMVVGACRHKGQNGPEAICAVSEGCGDHRGAPYYVRFGQPQAWQTGNGFTQHPVERATDGCSGRDENGVEHPPCGYVLVMSSNDPRLWTTGEYAQAGPMTVCVSMPNLDHWRCQHGEMGIDGKLYRFGQNDRGQDLPKR